jgi:peptidoglycan/LPS O-acetylase OafA/YrhL
MLYRITHLPAVPLHTVGMETDESKRIQTLRGLACLLLVAFHAIGSAVTSGLHVPNDSAYREFANMFVHIRMPLFTFISGFVYAYRPLRRFQERTFAFKKLRRLALPLVVASTLTYTLHVLLDDHSERPPLAHAWRIYVFPYEHFWFVQALLLIFAFVVLLERSGALHTLPRFLCLLGAAAVLHLHPPFPQVSLFSIREAAYLLPYFLLGLGAHRFRVQLQSRPVFRAALACFILTQAWHIGWVVTTVQPPIDADAHRTLLGLAIGMSSALCALRLVSHVPWVAAIGQASYPIYLYHPIFAAGVRMVADCIGGVPMAATFLACVVAGITGPRLLSSLANHIPGAPLLLEGRIGNGRSSMTAGGLSRTAT